MNLYDFVEKYIRVKGSDGTLKKFSERDLNVMKEMDSRINDGYHLGIVHNRSGTNFAWMKNKE